MNRGSRPFTIIVGKGSKISDQSVGRCLHARKKTRNLDRGPAAPAGGLFTVFTFRRRNDVLIRPKSERYRTPVFAKGGRFSETSSARVLHPERPVIRHPAGEIAPAFEQQSSRTLDIHRPRAGRFPRSRGAIRVIATATARASGSSPFATAVPVVPTSARQRRWADYVTPLDDDMR